MKLLYTKLLLSDLQRVGYHFILSSVESNTKRKQVVLGDLILNKEFIPVRCVFYHNGSPSKLLAVLGRTKEEASLNQEKIVRFMGHCISYNVNGVRATIKIRRATRIAKFLAITLSCLGMVKSCYMVFISSNYGFSLFCLLIFAIGFFFSLMYKSTN